MDSFRTGLKDTIGNGWEEIDARAISSIPPGIDDEGREVAVRVGRPGPYLQAGDIHPRAALLADSQPASWTLDEANRPARRARPPPRSYTQEPPHARRTRPVCGAHRLPSRRRPACTNLPR